MHVFRFRDVALMSQFEFSRLLLLQQRDHNIKAGSTPTASFILKPVAASRASSDG